MNENLGDVVRVLKEVGDKLSGISSDLKAIKKFIGSENVVMDMVLFCPRCKEQHIDEPEEVDPVDDYISETGSLHSRWTNPPHKSHLCKFCKYIWRPADFCTNGVRRINSKGKDDSPIIW